MRYYKDFYGDYYYLEESGRNVYDDKELTKDPSNEPTRSSYGFLSANLKSYLDELVKMILADNQVEIKAEIRASEARVTCQVESIRITVDYLGRTSVILDIGPSDIDTNTTVPVPDVTIVVPPSDDATDIA
ncbi:unnamed protein product [Vicia faba]|uniref:Uncharacterized protein n=1 Tax=Vicia faba TaxID=3906 RepID=A0AAV1AAR6_VICFA|nr:unnamed protein product [Vicia faba]